VRERIAVLAAVFALFAFAETSMAGTTDGGGKEASVSIEDLEKQLSGLTEAEESSKEKRGQVMCAIANIKMKNGDLTGAEKMFREALPLLEAGGEFSKPVVKCLGGLVDCLTKQNRNEDAKPLTIKQQNAAVAISGQPPQDKSKYVDWLNDAEDLGHPSAPTLHGLAYLRGEGVEKDAKKAAEFLAKGVVEGDGCAGVQLGLMYLRGEGVDKDEKKGKQYLEVASDYGVFYPSTGAENNGVAEYELGVCAETGNGLAKEESEAYMWYSLSKDSNCSKSTEAAAKLKAITDRLTPEEKDLYEQKLGTWKEGQQLAITPNFVPPKFAD